MAQLPVPGRTVAELSLPSLPSLPRDVLRRLAAAGHEAALVGGSLRDVIDGRRPVDWDIATSAHPEDVVALFPRSTWLNRFGTVTVHDPAGDAQVTTYRGESGYADRRRPDEVTLGVSLDEDLARRDFTINAMAWLPTNLDAGDGRLLDPFGGRDDLAARVLRAVGNPDARFAEDALRLMRAVRLAQQLELRIEPATAEAVRRLHRLVADVSAERLRDELQRILATPTPSRGLLLMEELGLLAIALPEVAALRGVPQSKPIAGDALDHTLRATDAVPDGDLLAAWAALLHDVGKASTLADGHFVGHEEVGARLAAAALDRLRLPNADAARIVHAIRHHMYAYEPEWTDAAVRRFLRRVGRDTQLLFDLRRADNAASGVGAIGDAHQRELEARIAALLADERTALEPGALVIDGHDLQRELGLSPGPRIGALLDRLTESVIDDPSRNERATLLRMAGELIKGS